MNPALTAQSVHWIAQQVFYPSRTPLPHCLLPQKLHAFVEVSYLGSHLIQTILSWYLRDVATRTSTDLDDKLLPPIQARHAHGDLLHRGAAGPGLLADGGEAGGGVAAPGRGDDDRRAGARGAAAAESGVEVRPERQSRRMLYVSKGKGRHHHRGGNGHRAV